jgi:hypothetical protein
MADWYRLHIRQTKDTYAFLSLGLALAESPTPANLDALRDGAFRDDLSERVRTEVLAAARTIDPEEQIAWLVEGFRSGRSIPVGYLDNRFRLGITDNGAIGRARALILAAVRARPDLPKRRRILLGCLPARRLVHVAGRRGESNLGARSNRWPRTRRPRTERGTLPREPPLISRDRIVDRLGGVCCQRVLLPAGDAVARCS